LKEQDKILEDEQNDEIPQNEQRNVEESSDKELSLNGFEFVDAT